MIVLRFFIGRKEGLSDFGNLDTQEGSPGMGERHEVGGPGTTKNEVKLFILSEQVWFFL